MTGTTPRGSAGEREASAWVRSMFGRIAPRYDLANHLLSFNLDRHWRAVTVSRVREILKRPGARALDVCCGTGDLLAALSGEAAGQDQRTVKHGKRGRPRASSWCWIGRAPGEVRKPEIRYAAREGERQVNHESAEDAILRDG